MDMKPLDRIDRKILTLLQQDCAIPIAELADKVGLSQTPCWKRVQKLQELGIITGRVALVDPETVGLKLTVLVALEAGDHTPAWIERFSTVAAAMPEVMDIYRMAGDVDYMLRVVVADMTAYDGFYKRLIDAVHVKNVTSRFAMECIKSTTALSLPEPDAN
jgi:Lrp/AsnC family transcriptional regulator